jgi:hypothetical protein
VNETLSILVHAGSKVGKTTLASTCPAPILILDAEGGSKFLNVRKIAWDPTRGGPPEYDGTWDVCVVTVRNFNDVTLAYDWLNFGGHSFRSVVIDSISETQRRCKNAVSPSGDLQGFGQWGDLLTRMDKVIRGYRDLTFHPTCPIQVAMFISETRENNGKWIPYMQGQISIALPYWMDVVGYLFVQEVPETEGAETTKEIRRLLVSPHPLYEAGERVQGRLGKVVDEPNITTMLTTIYPQLQGAQAQ